MNEYIYQLILFIEQYLDNKEEVSENIYQYNCLMCGRSRNNKPHMRIDFNKGFFYCYRCNEGGIIYNILKELKTSQNKEYINNILLKYFDVYDYDFSNNKNESFKLKKSYKYSLLNITDKNVNINVKGQSYTFLKYRFGLTDVKLLNLLKLFKISLNENRIWYKSFYSKYTHGYIVKSNTEYIKKKKVNYLLNGNDKVDYYYLINNYRFKNLYISEGVFDLMTIYIADILHNKDDSNYLALCSRNYRKLFDFLLNTGKFFYDNIYIIVDNDINKNKYLKNIINLLSNNKKINKYKLYSNIYTIFPDRKYIDLNKQYIKNNYILKNCAIKKII